MSDSDSDFMDDSSPKAKKAPAAKKTTPKKKKEDANTSMAMTEEDRNVFTSIDDKKGGSKKMAIEDIYQKKSQLEHILLRPDTYIGSVEYTEKTPIRLKSKRIKIPYLYRFRKNNRISVYNNGKGIPVTLHKVEKVYVPELIFGTLLTSSNYNDDEKKVTGGRNGYGAKLCNIFSTKFTLETSSKDFKSQFKQTWVKNMTREKEPDIKKSDSEDFTRITFQPDLSKFKMDELDDDICHLMARRAYDVAGSTKGVTVFLNGERVPVKGFEDYVKMYTSQFTNDGEPIKVAYEQVGDRWQVALALSEKGFQQVSFVNSIATTKGGRHVDYVADQMVAKFIDSIKRKLSKTAMNIKPFQIDPNSLNSSNTSICIHFQIKNHMWVFVNALIENPTFDSQTKETMTLQSKQFGSTCTLSEKFSKAAGNVGITDAVMSWVRFKQMDDLNKKCSKTKTSKLKGIPKLEDANDAGTKNSQQCTLILTEGDSAKTLAVSGLAVVGRDKFGVFPLRGKLLNVRDGNMKQIADNAEINAMIKILGLQYKKKYETEDDFKTLRYGKMMVMADQDQDGSHIKGLVINFVHHFWPSLIQRNFVEEFITPIVKASKGKEEVSFFSIPEYSEWRMNTDNWKTYKIKYYKGLGTSTSKEAKEYFSDMLRHRIKFKYGGAEDDMAVEMAFSKKKIDERKDWLTKWMQEKKARKLRGLAEEYLYNKDTRAVTFKDFVNRELVLFSNLDNERSIPCLVDGFKPGQRKVLFACFKRADKREVKVAQLAGAVAEISAYHHGEQSLMGTIVNLAQDFVGSNNINLLLPIGQFGTRLQGGKDSASARYIFTQLSPVTRSIFPAHDDNVLRFLYEENQRIEPEWYCPIIPMVLVNGAQGIGTGWSTNIPNYNPRDIVKNIKRLIAGESQKAIAPWYKNFRGNIIQIDSSRYACYGEVATIDDNTIEITELPVKQWTQDYKEKVLEALLDSSDKDKKAPLVLDYKEYHTDTTVKFVVKLAPGKLRELERGEDLHQVFKLQSVINTTCMVLFDAAGCLRTYSSPEEITQEFYDCRKEKYIQRKDYLLGVLQAQSQRLTNQARFIVAKINNEIVMENKKKAVIVETLIKMKFDPDPVKKWKEEQKLKELRESGEIELDEEDQVDDDEEDGEGTSASSSTKVLETKLSDYDYLVGMALIKLSEEEKNKLLRESEEKMAEVKSLEKKTWQDLWHDDLDNFMSELDKQEAREKADIDASIKNAAKKLAADVKAGRGSKKTVVAEVLPSKDGVRIEPKLDAATKAKYEKMAQPKKERVKKEPTEPKVEKKEGQDIKKFMSPAVKKSPKKKSQDGDFEDLSDDTDLEFGDEVTMSDDDDEEREEVVPKPKPRSERGAAKAVKPIVDLSDDEEMDGTPVKKAPPKKRKIDSDEDDFKIDSDSDSEKKKKPATKKPVPKKRKSEFSDLDDDSDDEDDKKPSTSNKKAAPAKKAAPKKVEPKKAEPKKTEPKKKTMDEFFGKKSSKKAAGSDDEDDDDIVVAPREKSGRARKPVASTYVDLGSDSESDSGPKNKKKRVIDSDSD
ncbi:CRE-TOP-2 protein [Caenorhabditis remanei]|uniref:DNA topoisomerase 2 n=2 Tax=Caenorhabditis remanei TaxID=31234 RepID=E3LH66_CAERE|nr:CRE-TOP-2 protein [Caenorhabditis remanei]